ncbi:MAG TPA: metallophosphoesterase [Candidatus Hydrogenedentes bacterium]|nr:metallophosphoesterase [Candidatus Hydrogenedentota bacterium]
MPAAVLPPMARRSFLQIAALGGFATVFGYEACADESGLHLALLSDTHIPADKQPGARGFNAFEQLTSIVSDLVATNADGLVITGDAAQLTGEKDDYAVLLDVLQPVTEAMPMYIALGNHDNRDNFMEMVKTLPGERPEVEDKHVTIIEHPAVRIVLLDSLFYVRQRGGLLGKAQREWLKTYLEANADRPAILMFHHTIGDGDNDLLDILRLFDLAKPFPHLKALFYGHSHRWEIGKREGIHTINLPTAAHIWTPDQPIGWVDARFRADGMALTMHAFAGNRALDGQVFEFNW